MTKRELRDHLAELAELGRYGQGELIAMKHEASTHLDHLAKLGGDIARHLVASQIYVCDSREQPKFRRDRAGEALVCWWVGRSMIGHYGYVCRIFDRQSSRLTRRLYG